MKKTSGKALVKNLSSSIIDHKNSSNFERWVEMEVNHAYNMGFIAGEREQMRKDYKFNSRL